MPDERYERRKMIYRRFYSIYDTPNTMLNTVRAVVQKNELTVIRLFDADAIKEQVEELIRDSNVIVVMVDSKDPLQLKYYKGVL